MTILFFFKKESNKYQNSDKMVDEKVELKQREFEKQRNCRHHGKAVSETGEKYLISEDLSKSEEVLKRSKGTTNNFKISNQKLERNI